MVPSHFNCVDFIFSMSIQLKSEEKKNDWEKCDSQNINETECFDVFFLLLLLVSVWYVNVCVQFAL